MAYCTRTDIVKQTDEETLVGLTDDFDTGVADEGVIAQAISDADAEIEVYCGERYRDSLPFSPVPAIIAKLSVDITIFNLYDRKLGAPEHIEKRHANAVKLLTNIARGTVTLGANAPAEAAGDVGEITSSGRIFSRTKLEGF